MTSNADREARPSSGGDSPSFLEELFQGEGDAAESGRDRQGRDSGRPERTSDGSQGEG